MEILPKLGRLCLDIFEPPTAATKVMLKKQFYSKKLFDPRRDPDE